MPLSFEQFQQLRQKGLSNEQIIKFEIGSMPKIQQGQQSVQRVPSMQSRRQTIRQPQALLERAGRKAQFIRKQPSFIERTLPAIGQFTGGLGGFAIGSTAGKPFVGSAVGGTAGRGIGVLTSKIISDIRRDPRGSLKKYGQATLKAVLTNPANIPAAQLMTAYEGLNNEEKSKFKRSMVGTGVTEAFTAAGGKVLSRVGGYLGNKIMEGLLGARVAQRGQEVGWKKILNPEFFKNRFPQRIAEKVGKFFSRLSNTTGKNVERTLLSPKYRNITVLTSDLKDNVTKIIPAGTKYSNIFQYIDDLSLRSGAEKNLVNQQTRKVMSMGGRSRRIHTLWKQRRELDKIINSRSWSDDATDYLVKLRRVLNNPIKGAGPEISEAFGKYQFVKEGEYDLGKKFTVSLGPGGQTFAQKPENFAATLLQTKNDEIIRRLKALDSFAGASDKVIDEFLDYAAAEGLEKGIGLGIWQEIMSSFFGGRKGLAQIGRFMQRPTTQVIRKGVGRLIPTTISEGLNVE